MPQLARGVDAGRRSLSVSPWRAVDPECPFCKRTPRQGRNQCRTNGELVACFGCGDLRVGTIFQTPNGPYYKTGRLGGYSGSHAIFAPHRDAAAFDSHEARKRADPVLRGVPALQQQAKGVRDAVARVRAQLSLEHATLDELRTYGRALRLVEQRLEAFTAELAKVRINNAKVAQLRASAKDWERQVRFARADMDRFLAHLGTPTRTGVGR